MIDHEILKLIIKRMKLCLEIGEIKEHLGKPIFDPEQEKRVIEDKAAVGVALGLREDLVRALMNL
jgi:chorismate mutase